MCIYEQNFCYNVKTLLIWTHIVELRPDERFCIYSFCIFLQWRFVFLTRIFFFIYLFSLLLCPPSLCSLCPSILSPPLPSFHLSFSAERSTLIKHRHALTHIIKGEREMQLYIYLCVCVCAYVCVCVMAAIQWIITFHITDTHSYPSLSAHQLFCTLLPIGWAPGYPIGSERQSSALIGWGWDAGGGGAEREAKGGGRCSVRMWTVTSLHPRAARRWLWMHRLDIDISRIGENWGRLDYIWMMTLDYWGFLLDFFFFGLWNIKDFLRPAFSFMWIESI